MKKLLTIPFLLPVLLFAQQKSPGFITKYHYLKFSPSLLLIEAGNILPPEKTLTPALFATIGGKISRYTAVGFHTGFFNLKGSNSTVIPLGAELTITDFKTKKVFPVITAQWSRTHFKEYYSVGGAYSHHSYNITGKQMYGISGGAAVPAFQTKIFITAGYSRIESKTIATLSSGPNYSSISSWKDHHNVLVLSLSLAL